MTRADQTRLRCVPLGVVLFVYAFYSLVASCMGYALQAHTRRHTKTMRRGTVSRSPVVEMNALVVSRKKRNVARTALHVGASASVSNDIQHRFEEDFRHHEERDKKEMSWLIKSTSKLLGEDAPPVGQLPRVDIRRAKPVMRAWARRSSRKLSPGVTNAAPHVVERLLMRIIEERDAGNGNARVTTDMYNLLIEAWARSSESGCAQHAEEVLDRMEKMYKSGNADVRPNSRSINAAIKAWLKCGEIGALERAEMLLKRAEKNHLATTRSYNLYLSALSQTTSVKDAAEKAEEVFERMKKVESGLAPDINTYNQIMSCWARRGGKAAAERAQKVFFDDLMLKSNSETDSITPNAVSFNIIINCWHKSGDTSALQRVGEILDTMDEMCQSGTIVANVVTINSALSVFAKVRTKSSIAMAEDLFSRAETVYKTSLDTLSYNLLIKMLSYRGTPQAAEKAVKLLDQLESRFRSHFGAEKEKLMPDVVTYTSVIDTLAKSNIRGCGKEAEDILHRMERLHRNNCGQKPTTEVFNAVINAWASSKEKGSIQRAEAILKRMEERHSAGDELAKPNRRSYNTVLKAHKFHGKPVQAESLLHKMEEAYKKSGNKYTVPDSYSYTTTISAYARSNYPGKAKKSLTILHRMCEFHKAGNPSAKPTVHTFNACLNACAYTSARGEKIEAFLIAVSTFLMLQQYDEPDHVTFGTFLRICSNLMPKGDDRRERIAEVIFKRCCRDGHVSALVLKQLSFAASPTLYQELIGKSVESRFSVDDLPMTWRRNVVKRQRGNSL